MEIYSRNEIIQWGIESIASHRLNVINNIPEIIQNTPWSLVLRFLTSGGYVYLKQVPEKIYIEAKIINVLKSKFSAPVPIVLSQNERLNCFLMKDAGIKLLDAYKKKADVSLLCSAVSVFAQVQLNVADKTEILINAGAPEWRTGKFHELFLEVVSDRDLLLEDGAHDHEFVELEKLKLWIKKIEEKINSYRIKSTLVQPDFNVNNILIDEHTGNFTVIDLGEIVISHPFFSIINFLHQIKKYNLVTENDPAYLKVRESYLSHYDSYGSVHDLINCLSVAELLFHIYGILAQYRLMIIYGTDKIMSLQKGRLSGSLRTLLDVKKSQQID